MTEEESLFDDVCWDIPCKCGGIFSDIDDGTLICNTCGIEMYSSTKDDSASTKCTCGGEYIHDGTDIVCNTCGVVSAMGLEERVSKTKKVKGYVSTEEQFKSFYNALKTLNDKAPKKGIKPFPKDMIEDTILMFFEVREFIKETRNNKLRSLFAECMHKVCLKHNRSRSVEELKSFFEIEKTNMTHSACIIQRLEKSGKIGSVDVDERRAYTVPICKDCGIMDQKDIDKICDLVVYILDISSKKMIGANSELKTKILSAAYIAMNFFGHKVSIQKINETRGIHVDTINCFLKQVKRWGKEFDFDGYRKRLESV